MTDRPRVLIVDDDRAITSTMTPILRDMADTDAAHTVAEALEKLAAHSYAGVVLDVVLGDDAAPLHDALSSREVPVLLLSGRDPLALERIASTRGWTFAAKPLSPAVLRGLVADLLDIEEPEPTQRGARVTQVPAAPAASKAAAPATPLVVQVLDKLGDLVAMLVVGYLCVAGKLSGELAVAVVAGIAGVGTTARAITGRSVGAASAAVALAALLSAAPSPASAATAAHRGTRPPHLAPPAALVALLALALSGCAGATAAAGVASAVQSTLTVIRDVRSLVCTAKLDPLFGNPREGEDTYAPVRRDAGPSPGAPADASSSSPSDGEAGAP